jgi:hypothetical protein
MTTSTHSHKAWTGKGGHVTSAETKAISDLQDVEWMGRSIRVNKAEPRPTSAFGNSRW